MLAIHMIIIQATGIAPVIVADVVVGHADTADGADRLRRAVTKEVTNPFTSIGRIWVAVREINPDGSMVANFVIRHSYN